MRKAGKINLLFRQMVLILLSVLVLVIFWKSCFYFPYGFLPNSQRDAALCIVPGVLLFSGALIMLFHRMEQIQCENEKKVTAALWGIIIVLQTITVCLLIKDGFKGITDTAHIIDEAIAMLDTQQGCINNNEPYFARYGNNYPITILFYYICKMVRFFGLRCYTAVLMILNMILIDCSGVFAFKLVKMLRGNVAGIKFLVLFLLSPTTYIWILYTYTNTFSMPFIMGLLYYGIRAIRRKEHRMRNIMLAAVIGAVGYQIRATTVIPLIAVVFGILLAARIRQKKEKRIMVLLVVGIFIGMMLISSCFCRRHLVNHGQDRTFPFTHWVMMGVNIRQSGSVNKHDVRLTMSKPTKQEKIRKNLKKIKKRLQDMGPAGYAELIIKKMEMVWAYGEDGSRRYYTVGENISEIYSYINGDKSGFFAVYSQVFRSTTFLFVLFSLLIQIRRKGVEEFFVIPLTLLGIILFLILWEANRKYNICFMTPVYILMGDGITRTLACARKANVSHGLTQKKFFRWGIRLFFFSIPAILSFFMAIEYPYYIQRKSDYHKAVISNVCYKEQKQVLDRRGDVVEQTFVTNRQFDEIGVMCTNEGINKDSYRYQILDGNGKQIPIRDVSVKTTFKTANHWLLFHLDTIAPVASGKYTIRIECLKDNREGMALFVNPFDKYELYTGGELKVNSVRSQRDIAFCVALREEESMIGVGGYVLFGLTVWIWTGVLCCFFSRRRYFLKEETTTHMVSGHWNYC